MRPDEAAALFQILKKKVPNTKPEGCAIFPQDAGCVEVGEEGSIEALTMGRTASFYYLKHESMRVLSQGLRAGLAVPEVGPARHSFADRGPLAGHAPSCKP